MARGGRRQGAGKKSSWHSGCKFPDTKLIRVPKVIASQVLRIAHFLDAGYDYESHIDQLNKENQSLQKEVDLLVKRNSELCSLLEKFKASV